MKKNILFSLLVMISLFFVIGNVNAADDSVLVPFIEESNETILNSDGTIDGVDFGTKQYQESVSVEAYVCSVVTADSSGKYKYIKNQGCEAATGVSYTVSNTNVATYAGNLLTFLSTGEASLNIGATIDNDAVSISVPFTVKVTGDSSNADVNTNTGEANIEDDEEAKDVPKSGTVEKDVDKDVSKDSEEIVGKLTGKNPNTGIDDYVVYLVAISLILGTGVVFKRRLS